VQPTTASYDGGTSLVNASHTSDMSTTSASHVGGKKPTYASHVGGTILVIVSHTRKMSPTSASHVG
jgi:hypothetical protein